MVEMAEQFHWVGDSEEALSWIRNQGADVDGVGFPVGPMPEQAYLLHPIFERIDGQPVQLVSIESAQDVDQPDEDMAPLRRVTWAEYATRRGVPMVTAAQHLSWSMPFAKQFAESEDDQYVWAPSEGAIVDSRTLEALFDVLVQHTDGGVNAVCTAFHWALDAVQARPEVLRGPLGYWSELYVGNQVYSPQNIWPDTHEWVLYTGPDMWATAISGTADLVRDLVDSPELEVLSL